LEVIDLFLAKCAANREKDRVFNLALLRHRIVDVDVARMRVPSMPLDDAAQQRVMELIARLCAAVESDTLNN
jgi:hypothetical protein